MSDERMKIERKPLWSVTTWDKKFNAVAPGKQRSSIKYHYLLAADLKSKVVAGGDVKLLTTNETDLWTTEDRVEGLVSEGEVVTIPWGGNPNVQYYKGRFVTADNRIATSSDVKVLDNKYLYYFMLANKDVIGSYYRGAGLKHPEMAKVLDMEIPLPPVAQQQKVVRRFDGIVNLIAKRKEQLAKLDQLVKSRFVEMFGDEKWPRTTLGELSEFLTSGSRGWAKYYSDEGELFITIKNVKNSRITIDDVQHIVPPQGAEADRTRVREGDLLISITADLGRTGVVTREIESHGAYINQHLTRVCLKRDVVDPLYAAFYIESPEGKAQIERRNQSAVKAGLNFDCIRSIQLPLPPIGEQRKFAAFVEKVDKSEFAVRKSLEELQKLYRQQLQEAFG